MSKHKGGKKGRKQWEQKKAFNTELEVLLKDYRSKSTPIYDRQGK